MRTILPLPLREGVGGRGALNIVSTAPSPNPLPRGEGENIHSHRQGVLNDHSAAARHAYPPPIPRTRLVAADRAALRGRRDHRGAAHRHARHHRQHLADRCARGHGAGAHPTASVHPLSLGPRAEPGAERDLSRHVRRRQRIDAAHRHPIRSRPPRPRPRVVRRRVPGHAARRLPAVSHVRFRCVPGNRRLATRCRGGRGNQRRR